MESKFEGLARIIRFRKPLRQQVTEDVEQEIRFHLQMRTEELMRAGMAEEEARKQALREFGDPERAKRALRQESARTERRIRGLERIDQVRQDLRLALRRLRKRPGFTAVAALTLALGIGATTALFSVVNGVLLKPLPFQEPERLVALWHAMPGIGLDRMGLATGTYFTFRDENRVFEELGLWSTPLMTVTGVAEPEWVAALQVTDATLRLLGVRPALGRLFTAEDVDPSSPLTVILGHGYWQSRFGGDPGVIGRSLTVNGDPMEVIGVLPRAFSFMDREPAMLSPFRLDRSRAIVASFNYPAIARLRPGVTLEEARADLVRLIPLAVEKYPGGFTLERARETQLSPLVRPLKEEVVGGVDTVLWFLLGAVGIVLLIACANVANLFLVRADGRQHEVAVRTALGAGRGRIAREFLLESLALGILGGATGLGLAFGAIQLLKTIGAQNLPRLHEIALDPPVLIFTLGVSVLAALFFGSFPVLKYARPDLVSSLKEGGRGGTEGRQRHRARSGLAIAQVALALVLLIGAGLMIRSLGALWGVHPGFERPEEVLTFSLFIPSAEVADHDGVARTHERILRAIEAIPGVAAVGLSTSVPMDRRGYTNMTHVKDITGESPPSRRYKFVSEGYFETMGIPVLAGRPIAWPDIHGRRPVAVVNERFAREYFDGPAAAIGKLIAQDPDGGWREIVGVVGDVHDDGLDREARVLVYWPFAVSDFWGADVLVMRSLVYAVRAAGVAPHNVLGQVRAAVWSVNPNLPLANVRTQKAILDLSTARTSFTMVLLSIAAAVALLLGAVGIYGVISYIVAQRTREIGVRVALGARREDVRRLVLRQGGLVVAVGIAVGLAAAVGLTRLMSAMLFGVSPLDPVTYAAVSVGLGIIALLAIYIPARRAANVDPVEALRWE